MSSPRQHKEGCLECVFGIMRIADDSLTHAKNHWTVSAHDRCERGLISMVDQSIQKLSIARRSGNDNRAAEAFNNIGQLAGGHRSPQHV
jgi:hypothetical protein